MSRMIIIAGMARSGKSKLANHVATAGYSRIPGDAIISTMQKLYPETGISHEGDYPVICRAFFPFLNRFVSALKHEHASFVLDTARLLPEDAAKLVADYGIAVAYLGYPTLSPADKLNHLRAFPNTTDWTRDIPDPLLTDMVVNLIALSRETAADCERYQLPFFDTGSDFEGTLKRACLQLTGKPIPQAAKPERPAPPQ